MEARIDRALSCLRNYNAYVKMISSSQGDDSNWQKLVDVLSDPSSNRPFKQLNQQADRTMVWDFAAKTYIQREIKKERGGYKKDATHGPKTSVTLAPPNGKMNYFWFDGGYAIGILFDGDKLDFKMRSDGKKGKLVFPKNASTNSKPWIKGQSNSAMPEAVTLEELILQVKNNYENGIITGWNEAMACLAKEAGIAIVVPKNYVCDRLNALCRQQFIKKRLGLDLPILIMTPDADVSVYTIEQQVNDILEALKREDNNAAAKFLSHIDPAELDLKEYHLQSIPCDGGTITKLYKKGFTPLIAVLLEKNPALMQGFDPTDFGEGLLVWSIYLNCMQVASWLPESKNTHVRKVMKDQELLAALRKKENHTNIEFYQVNASNAVTRNPLIRRLFIEGKITIPQLTHIHYGSSALNNMLSIASIQAVLGNKNMLDRLHALTEKEVSILKANSWALECFISGVEAKYLMGLDYERLNQLYWGARWLIKTPFVAKSIAKGRFTMAELEKVKTKVCLDAMEFEFVFRRILDKKINMEQLNLLNEIGLAVIKKTEGFDFLLLEALEKGIVQVEDINQFNAKNNTLSCNDVAVFLKYCYEKYGRERLLAYIAMLKQHQMDQLKEIITSLFKALNWTSVVILDPVLVVDMLQEAPEMINQAFGAEANTFLHLACEAGQVKLVQDLLAFPGVKVTIERADKATSFHLAAKQPSMRALFTKDALYQLEVLRLSFEKKTDINEHIKQMIVTIYEESGCRGVELVLDELEKHANFTIFYNACSNILSNLLDDIYKPEMDKKLIQRVISLSIEKLNSNSPSRDFQFDLNNQRRPHYLVDKVAEFHGWKYKEIANRVDRDDKHCLYKGLLLILHKERLQKIILDIEQHCENKWFFFEDSRQLIMKSLPVLKRLIEASKNLNGLLSRLVYFVELGSNFTFTNVYFAKFIGSLKVEIADITKVQPLSYTYQQPITLFGESETRPVRARDGSGRAMAKVSV